MNRIRSTYARVAGSATTLQSASLIGWQAVSMVGSLGLTALIARGLDVADYGTYRYAVTFLALGMTLLQFGLPYSVARLLALENDPVAQKKIVGIGAMTVLAATAVGVFVTCCTVLAGRSAGLDLQLILLWVSPALCVTLGQAMISSACQGLGRISLLASQQVLPYVILLPATALQLFVLRHYSLAAALVGYVATFLLVIHIGFRRLGVSFQDLRSTWSALKRENRRTGLPIYVGGVFGVASAQFISMWVAAFVRPDDYGQYALAVAVSAPLGVLLSSIGTVIFRSSSRLSRLPLDLIVLTGSTGVALGIAYWIATEWLLTVVFGDKYGPAVWMAQLLGIASLLIGLGDVLQRFLGAHGLGRALGAASVATGVVGMLTAAVLLPRMTTTGAIVASISAAATYVTLLAIVYVHYTTRGGGGADGTAARNRDSGA
jgi:O-antigen/teichoic acid export membrane protein